MEISSLVNIALYDIIDINIRSILLIYIYASEVNRESITSMIMYVK